MRTKTYHLSFIALHDSKNFLNILEPCLSSIRIISAFESSWMVFQKSLQHTNPIITTSIRLLPHSLSHSLQRSSNSSIIPSSHSLFTTQRTIIRKHDDIIQLSDNTNDSTTWPDGPTCSDTNCNTPFSQHVNII